MKVFINPGHAPNGNPDPGACCNGLRECDVAHNVANLLAGYLVTAGVEVADVLQDDSLSAICDNANSSGADLFISIHCNSVANPNAEGTETWYWQGSVKGKKLSECINKQICSSLGTINRGAKPTTGLYVIKHTGCTAVLVEMAFISNMDENILLKQNQDEFARAIARGVTDYQRGRIV